jgi:hypothetical protein
VEGSFDRDTMVAFRTEFSSTDQDRWSPEYVTEPPHAGVKADAESVSAVLRVIVRWD